MSRIVDKDLDDFIIEIEEKCAVCLKYNKAPLKLVVGFPLSRDFKDVISINLKEINGFKILLHLIDHETRYSAATIVKSKQKEIV